MNIQTRGSFLKLKCPFPKTSAGQMALSYNGPTISNASAFEKKGMRQLHASPRNSEAIDV